MAERSFARAVQQFRLGAGAAIRGEAVPAITKALLENGVSYVAGYPAAHFIPRYPARHSMHGCGRYGLQGPADLDQPSPTGTRPLAAPRKIRQGSGSPLRVLALVETKP